MCITELCINVHLFVNPRLGSGLILMFNVQLTSNKINIIINKDLLLYLKCFIVKQIYEYTLNLPFSDR